MRLLNVKTQKFEDFYGDKVPPYAILSHRWGKEEATFQDIKSGRLSGWRKSWSWPLKLEGCRLQAKKDNLSYIWVDTCCIDKTNSVELAEAINSMFTWYKNATRCYAYLPDVRFFDNDPRSQAQFRASSWFTRGWTLQELLAPKEVHFYNSAWELIGTKYKLSPIIEDVTRIPRAFLIGWAGLHEASVAQRMSWAANRVTTRTEDLAYCLLGIFGVTMPMIYGEKEQAFVRLQLEIMKNSNDHSILAWGFGSGQYAADGKPLTVPGGALATSPADFAGSSGICVWNKQQTRNSFEFLGGSLRMQVYFVTNSAGQVFGLLNCCLENNKENLVGIPLNAISADESTENCLRPAGCPSSLFPRIEMQNSSPRLVCIRRDLKVSESKSARRHCFYIEEYAAIVKLIDVIPANRWMKDKGMIMTSNEARAETREEFFLRFRPKGNSGDDFVVVLVFELQESLARGTGHTMILSRMVPLSELAKGFKTIKTHLYGQQNCSNGQVGVRLSVKQETVAGEDVFVVELMLAETSDVEGETVNATEQLALLRQKQENEKRRRVLENEHAINLELRRKLDGQLNSITSELQQATNDREVTHLKARDAESDLNEAKARMLKAKEVFDLIFNAYRDARDKEEKMKATSTGYVNKLQQLQFREEKIQKELEKLIRESGASVEDEPKLDYDREPRIITHQPRSVQVSQLDMKREQQNTKIQQNDKEGGRKNQVLEKERDTVRKTAQFQKNKREITREISPEREEGIDISLVQIQETEISPVRERSIEIFPVSVRETFPVSVRETDISLVRERRPQHDIRERRPPHYNRERERSPVRERRRETSPARIEERERSRSESRVRERNRVRERDSPNPRERERERSPVREGRRETSPARIEERERPRSRSPVRERRRRETSSDLTEERERSGE